MSKPNIVLILTDDQPRGLLDAMPITRHHIRAKGCTFPTGIITTPLCGPSRSSILTGKWAHGHGMWHNSGADGGWTQLQPHEHNTIATALVAEGYRTGLFGKYMNGWNKVREVPPGWSEFAAIVPDDGGDGAYYNYSLVGTGPQVHYSSKPEDYSTDVVAQRATNFILATPQDQPLFLYFSPYGVHGSFIPAPRHQDKWPLAPVPPSVNDSNRKRSPWMQDLEKVDEVKVQETIRDQHETIMSVDDAVDAILTALGDRASNTLFIFSGDNGLQRGDHRLNGKNVPYQSALNVQMLMRWDGVIQPGSKDENPITNEDLPVTMAAAADTVLDGAKGTSALAPLNTRPGVYIEGAAQEGAPGWIGWRTRRHMYCNFGEGQGEELYDYDDDKWELDNIASTAPKTLASLRNRTLSADHPLPPGFTPYKP